MSDEVTYRKFNIRRLHIHITISSDGCAEIIFGRACRVLLFFPPAISYISDKLIWDWNVMRPYRLSIWNRTPPPSDMQKEKNNAEA